MSTPPWPIPGVRPALECRSLLAGIEALACLGGPGSPRLAAGGWASRAELARRELAPTQSRTVFLSSGLWKMVWLVKLSARRRGPRLLACKCAKPHLALVSSPACAASLQISRRAECSIFAPPNSLAIANGLRVAKSWQRSFWQASRSCRKKNCPDLRHLCSSQFLVLSVRCPIDKQAACHRVVSLGPHAVGHPECTADAPVDQQGGMASNFVRSFDFLY